MGNKIRKSEKIGRALFGFFFPIFDALIGWYRTLRNLDSNCFWDTSQNSPNKKENDDRFGRILPTTAKLTRFLSVGAALVCILGFIGALFVPIPGIAPLYAVTVAGICKATGITLGWSAVGRFIGAIFGTFCDFLKFKSVVDEKKAADKKAGMKNNNQSSTSLIMSKTSDIAKGYAKAALTVSFFGEVGPHMVAMQVQTKTASLPPTPPKPKPPAPNSLAQKYPYELVSHEDEDEGDGDAPRFHTVSLS